MRVQKYILEAAMHAGTIVLLPRSLALGLFPAQQKRECLFYSVAAAVGRSSSDGCD